MIAATQRPFNPGAVFRRPHLAHGFYARTQSEAALEFSTAPLLQGPSSGDDGPAIA
jgi:hypothetical protein